MNRKKNKTSDVNRSISNGTRFVSLYIPGFSFRYVSFQEILSVTRSVTVPFLFQEHWDSIIIPFISSLFRLRKGKIYPQKKPHFLPFLAPKTHYGGSNERIVTIFRHANWNRFT